MKTKIPLPEIKVKVTYKMKGGYDPEKLIKFESSQDVAKTCRTIFEADNIAWKEEFILLCLNRANKLIGHFKVSSGGIAGTVADPKVIYTIA